MSEPEDLAFYALAGVIFGLFVVLLLAVCGVIKPAHAHEHCIRQDYMLEGKAGYQWECVKWAKL